VSADNAVAAGRFRLVQPLVGGGEHVRNARARRIAVEPDADRHAQAGLRVLPRVRLDTLANPLGQRRSLGRLAFGEDDCKLLAAVAGDDVADCFRFDVRLKPDATRGRTARSAWKADTTDGKAPR